MAKILIVDDEEEVVASLKIILEEEGHVVDSASSAEAGLKKIEKGQLPDLVIIDVMMETIAAGIALAQEIKNAVPLAHNLPLIILSSIKVQFPGLRFGQDEEQGRLPAERFIEKPYTPGIIRRAVRQLLEAKGK